MWCNRTVSATIPAPARLDTRSAGSTIVTGATRDSSHVAAIERRHGRAVVPRARPPTTLRRRVGADMTSAPRIGVAAASILAAAAWAQEEPQECPYFTAMPEYVLESSEDRDFDAHPFFDGHAVVTVEGKLCSSYYALREGARQASELQIIRNYAAALRAIGGVVFIEGACEAAACGDYEGWKLVTGKAGKNGKEVWLELVPHNGGADYQMTVVERQPMRQDVTASGLLAALNADGHVALHIEFDTNRAEIRPESKPIVEQVVAMLLGNPGLSLSVEGHTDATGTAARNLVLSEQRARSVVAALVAGGVEPSRLAAAGYGQERPVADNSSEEGRAKNRRVELVKR
jgi:OmpA-OmpF porin, OOP family